MVRERFRAVTKRMSQREESTVIGKVAEVTWGIEIEGAATEHAAEFEYDIAHEEDLATASCVI